MLNQKGFTMREMIILCSLLAVFFAVAIAKVSYAYQEIVNEEEVEAMWNGKLLEAAQLYVEANAEKFTEEETYFYAKELVDNQFFIDIEEVDTQTTRFKVTHEEDRFVVELAP